MSTKPLNEQIRDQIEFYFSDANLARDTFLKEKIAQNRDGYVTIECLLTFKKLAGMTTDAKVVAEALQGSEALSVDTDSLSVKRVNPFDDSIDYAKQTVVIYPVPAEATEAEIRSALSEFCPEANIAAIWRKKKKHPTTKISMAIAEVHCNDEKDVSTLVEKSEEGKKIDFPKADGFTAQTVTAKPKTDFDALFVGSTDKSSTKPKGADYTVTDITGKVLDLTAESPIGTVKYIKNIPHESVRVNISYVHVLQGELNRMIVLFETKEACAEGLKAYEGAQVESKIISEGEEGSDKPTSGISAKEVEDEAILQTVLLGFQERNAKQGGNKRFSGYKGRSQYGKGKRQRRN